MQEAESRKQKVRGETPGPETRDPKHGTQDPGPETRDSKRVTSRLHRYSCP